MFGIDITSTLSTSAYVNRMIPQTNQRLYLLSQLKSQGTAVHALHHLFTGLIVSKITNALPASAGQLANDRNRINAVSRRSVTLLLLILRKLLRVLIANFSKITHPGLVQAYTIYSLLKPLHTALTVSEKRQHYYQLPNIEFSQYKNCFINRCLFKFRWSYFVCFVLLYFCNILYVLSLLRLIHLSLCNSVRLTCWIKRLLDFTSICSRQQIGSRTDMWR